MGNELLGQVTEATGLPGDAVSNELDRLIREAGKNPDDITLDDLRMILADYLQEVILQAQHESSLR